MNSNEESNEGVFGYEVEIKTDCPHIPQHINEKEDNHFNESCHSCKDDKENWQCLDCRKVYCSRHRSGHMEQHFKEKNADHINDNVSTSHSVCISYSDLSAWCYKCDSYVNHKNLDSIKKSLYFSKFGEEPSF